MENEYLLQVALELKDHMSKNLEEVNRELAGLKKDMKAAGIDIDELGGKVNKNTVSMKGALSSLSKTAKITTAALVGVAGMAIKSFADTEYSVKKVQTISNKSFDEIKTGAYDLAKKYGGNVGDILQANYDLVSSMGDLKDSHIVLDQAAQLSLAGFTSLGGAVNALSSVMNAYKMKASEVTKVSDILMQVQNSGVTTIAELEGSLSNILPTAASLKVGFEEIAAAMATMTSNKVPTAQATTQLRQALAELAKEGTKADKVFRQITGDSFTKFIEKGGTMVDAFNLLEQSAKNSNKTLYDIFGSVEATGAVLNLTGDNIEKFRDSLDKVAKSSGTTGTAVKGLTTSFKIEFDQLKAVGKEVADTVGEELVPYVRELKKALEEVNIKDLLSKENVDYAISMSKWVGGIGIAVWSIAAAVNGVETAIKGATYLKLLMSLVSKGALAAGGIGAATGGAATLVYGVHDLNNMDKTNTKDLDNLKKYNDELENKRELLLAIEQDLKMGIANSGMLSTSSGLEDLKKALVDGDIQKALKEINDELLKIESKNSVDVILTGLESETKEIEKKKEENSSGNGNSKGGKIISEEEKKLLEDLQNLNSNINNRAIAFDMTELEKAEYKLKELESMLGRGLDLKLDLSPMIKQYQEVKEYVDQLKTEIEFKEIKENFEKEFANLNIEFEIFGTEEKNRLLQTIRVLEGQISKAISEGMLGEATELGKKLETTKEEYTTNYEIPEKATNDFDKNLKGMGDSLYKVADVLENDFLNSIAGIMNSFGALATSLVGSDGKSGLFGNIGGLTGSASGLPGMEFLSTGSAIMGVAGAAVGVVSSLFGGKDKTAEIEAKNKENIRKFEENTSAIRELTNQIAANTSTLRGVSNELLSNLAKNPTISRLADGEGAIAKMQKAIEDSKEFSNLTAIEKGSKKTGSWYNKKKVDTFTEIGISDKTLLELLGMKGDTIEDLSFEQLKIFSDNLEKMDTQFLASALGKNLTESNIKDLKLQINEYIKQIEMLEKEQADLFKGATLESFRGVQYIDDKELKQQYIEMYEDMGIDTSQYMDVIDELVAANAVLITSMEAVRAEIIAGSQSFSQAMSSYFSDIIYNVSSILYDTMFSDLDEYFTDLFEDISEKLVEMKKQGEKINPEELFKDFDFDKLLEGDKLQAEMKAQIDEMKSYLKEMGLDLDIIDAIFGEGKVEKLKGYLSSAMSEALDANDFDVFSKSLGQSLYDNVKESLVAAFSESKLYKSLMEKFMPDLESELDSAGTFEEAFEIMNNYLKEFEHKLQGSGLGFDYVGSGDEISKNDASLGSYYTEEKAEIKIEIVQHFNGAFYTEDVMYKVAKEGTYEALEEIKNNGQILSSF